MKTISSKILIIFLMLSFVSTVGAAPAAIYLVKTPITGTETFGYIPDPNPGTITVKDGKTIFKNFVQYMYDDMSDPRASGVFRAELDIVFDTATWSGPFKCSIQVTNNNGSWVGSGIGYIYPDGHAWAYSCLAGQGSYTGLTRCVEATSLDGMYSSTMNGYILEYK
jgi:hypothetical protein